MTDPLPGWQAHLQALEHELFELILHEIRYNAVVWGEQKSIIVTLALISIVVTLFEVETIASIRQ